MSTLLPDLISQTATLSPDAPALHFKQETLSYAQLEHAVARAASVLLSLDLAADERVAVYLPKQFETVFGIYGAARAGGVFVPVNPLLKAPQVAYILKDCNVRVLITSKERLEQLSEVLADCHDLHTVLVTNPEGAPTRLGRIDVRSWPELMNSAPDAQPPRRIDADLTAILYTSGSTGNPKGVVLSHRNMVAGALSVAEYLDNRPEDRLLAVLPFSFDYGLSQMSTAFARGASVVLFEYLLPRDVLKACAQYRITGLAAVPPLWVQLAQMDWPEEAKASLRYITNSGGAMPTATVAALRAGLPNTQVFLMYGLTEAFRSTYLPPEELDRRPGSMGKAIPNAEILVVREDGSLCGPNEPGELVHRGALVGQGYWNAPEKTAERYKPAPNCWPGCQPEIAVWSGDTVRRDEDGFLYFIGRKDDMIKTSGYRVSPTEVEEVIYGHPDVAEVAAIGIAHPQLGQAVVLVVKPSAMNLFREDAVLKHCKSRLPGFMQPSKIVLREVLPRNPNGKIDRKSLAGEYAELFADLFAALGEAR
ncbi:MAG: acyl-CoA ligase (AMP-forming), exosortase A system-associated [Gammaproteobacteria bacterium]|nr:acyl-CoA ligase (AMP-forming), exosortase A system-associated [Gammaproteobacteria bacterium]